MNNNLASDYHQQYSEQETYFSESDDFCFICKPMFTETNQGRVSVTNWGMPGSASPVIFPVVDYVLITLFVNDEPYTVILSQTVLFEYLGVQYELERRQDPVLHFRVVFPDSLIASDGQDADFINGLMALPRVN